MASPHQSEVSIGQPGRKRSLGESGYMYMYGWDPFLFTWNYHNIVNKSQKVRHNLATEQQQYSNIKQKAKTFFLFEKLEKEESCCDEESWKSSGVISVSTPKGMLDPW